MTIHATFNPIGSTNPKDLIDNAQNLDYLILGPALLYPDRRGVNRLSWAGIEASFAAAQAQRNAEHNADQSRRESEFDADQARRESEFDAAQVDRSDRFDTFIASSGYDVIGDYASQPVTFTERNQLMLKGGELWKPKASVALPYVTTGVWGTESVNFVSVGDAALRQELSKKLVPNAVDSGATGTGSADQAGNLNAGIAASWALDINSGVYPLSSTVTAKGKDLETRGSVMAMQVGGDPLLAHEQIVEGILFPQEAYQKYDASFFWKVGPVIAFWGDSNTAFCDATANRVTTLGEGSTPANVEMKLREYVYYAEGRVRGDGSPGETAEFGWAGLEGAISTFQPQVMVLAWGTNDIAQGYTREQYLDFMRLQIERLLIGGIRPMVQSIPYHGTEANRLKAVAWNSSLKKLCDFYGVRFIPLYSLFANTTSYYFWSDNVHYQAPATRVISQIVCDAILDEYGLPKDRFNVNLARRGAIGIDGSFGLSGLRHSGGRPLTVVQTPNIYLRQFYPYSIKVPAGTEVHFQAAGPFSAIFNRPDGPATGYKVNGGTTTTLTRGNTIGINSIASRFDGSYSNFRVSHDTADLYLVATHSMAEFPVDLRFSAAEVSSSQFIPGQPITVTDGTKALQTVMQDAAAGLKGTALNSSIPNVGPIAVRTAITAAPEGFLFLQTGTVGWWRWASGAWVAM